MVKGKNVKKVVRSLLARGRGVSSGEVAAAAGVTRQGAHYHLRQMVEAGELVATGAGRSARYRHAGEYHRRFDRQGLREHEVWLDVGDGVDLAGMAPGAVDIARYAFTEMLNNAIDHSGSDVVFVTVGVANGELSFSVVDKGVGAFRHVQESLGFDTEADALIEISKGKTTTAPERHSGEGIFFTSKVVARFDLEANGLRWVVDNQRHDSASGSSEVDRGTRVTCRVASEVSATLEDVFNEFAPNAEFDRTKVSVVLSASGDAFVSRSEAKRVASGLERFREVVVDFEGVRLVGQGFADELFRVWGSDHPEVTLLPTGMSDGVAVTVQRAIDSDGT